MLSRTVYAQDTTALRLDKPPENAIWLDSLDIKKMARHAGRLMGGKSVDGSPMFIKNTLFRHGIGVCSDSAIWIDLKGAAVRFVSMVGIDDFRHGIGAVTFQVWVDGKKVKQISGMRGGDKPSLISVDVTGAQRLMLVSSGEEIGGCENGVGWGGAHLVLMPDVKEKPEVAEFEEETSLPIASGDPPEPAIHAPRIVGTTPGRPFLFLIPATGEPPLAFSVKNLPEGLSLDSKTGIITGSMKKEGEFVVELTVDGPRGTAMRKLKIISGKNKLALTPPMGWNSWNVWGLSVDDEKVRRAADWMIKSGLAAHGFQYINIDDGWEKGRAENGEIVPNEKFPDMKALADYVHSKGLKLGIYTSPGPKTCGGYEGSYQHEFQDAETYANWGIDYIKYDWCSYGAYAKGNSRPELMKPYLLMREALDGVGRDIVYSLCQYGMGAVWEWGAEAGGNLWRTTGDITDNWGSMAGIGFGQSGHEKYARPGHWNDPDMLVVGKVGWGPMVHPTGLTPNEQITHITLWSILAAPLLLGCDLSGMDQFTIDLLTNEEVLEVDQDPLGIQGSLVMKDGMFEVWARPLWDGTKAVALFNKFIERAEITVKWSDIGISGGQPVRDLWQQKDLGMFDGSFTAAVPAHGALLVKIGKPKTTDW
ncbi:MAG: NPCBM/NEW2 domain-containing protein [bacterium]